MKSRWKEKNYNEELDCWVVFWGDNSGDKMGCGEWFDLHLGMGRLFPAGWNWVGIGIFSLVVTM
ncbi:hypothetical protein G3A_02070 [Bacillus sp. 17376]|uniref:DUF5348 domain-containing protein n=1 Tax=Mesobacillus boroniphilus JCM 21738 TaxID=1294265 RepID=W4RTY2_9BACI|nr:DUF5348 domain-containing protein [Mesobacillus boroniphilus]ESU34235.1 hypothetical protein G3A_02070 [Bacillus sp. 17376]GAE47328.1 hypothetical protein JCM21738_4297 [Mesobacillus boroniphilus JCM 21738]